MRRWFAWLKPSYLPLAIGASVVLISWFHLMWNTTVGEAIPGIRFRTKTTIAGLMQDAAPLLSVKAVLNGSYQQWISRSIGKLSPMFKPAITWKNEIYYTLLGTAGSASVVVGREQQLMEMPYLTEYCSRDLAKLRAQGEDWAARIRRMQDYFDARGKVFLYVITPSKVAQSPQYMPDGYACPAPARDREEKLRVYDEILTRHGVRFVDTASDLGAAREEYGITMFPRGGTHWNSLASALGTQKVIAAVNGQRAEPLLAALSFAWRISYNPQGGDRDLLDLMNLKHPDTHYPVPELTYQSAPPSGSCHDVGIIEVGGSFLASLNWTLEKLACPPRITNWFYWEQRRLQYGNGRVYELPMDEDARRQSLLDADVVLFEENEAAGPDSRHGELMMQAVAALAGGQP